ncbi:MAG: GntR family transcriptional regulator [Rhodobacteraceae bacterium]|nr:GntR family transcriptional regulator [Paracoccaceae bacterium]
MIQQQPNAGRSKRRRRAPSQPPSGSARFAQNGGQTSADLIYEKLHNAIAQMQLRPGAPVSELSLSSEYGVSRTPVREAIQRLAKEKLVEIVPKSGTFVGRIPVSALVEAIVARRALEQVNVRKATERATASQLLQFRALLQHQKETAATGDLVAFHRADETFHAYFATVAGYDGIWELIRQVKLQLDRYRQLTLPQTGRTEMILDEHCAIIDAMEAGDSNAAADAMGSHLDKLELDLAVFGELWPDYFIHDKEFES